MKTVSPPHRFFDNDRSLEYDRLIRCSLPGYEALHAMVRDFLTILLPDSAHILIVGAGTGMDIITLGESNPKWIFTAVDLSPEMLSVCKSRIAASKLNNPVIYHLGGIESLPKTARFHAATSILVSHFIKNIRDKERYLKAINSRLLPKSPFLTADLSADLNDLSTPLFRNAWIRHNVLNGRPVREVEKDFKKSAEVVSIIPTADYEKILKKCSFINPRKFFKAFMFCGWISFKG